jgi:hypothetical protein
LDIGIATLYFKGSYKLIYAFICKFVLNELLVAPMIYRRKRFGKSQNGRPASIVASCREIPMSLRRVLSRFAKARRCAQTVKAIVKGSAFSVSWLRKTQVCKGFRIKIMSCPFVMQCHFLIRYVDVSMMLCDNKNEWLIDETSGLLISQEI